MQRAIPVLAHAYGDTDSRKAPTYVQLVRTRMRRGRDDKVWSRTLKASPLPVNNMSERIDSQQMTDPSSVAMRVASVSATNICYDARTQSDNGQKGRETSHAIRIVVASHLILMCPIRVSDR